MKKFILISISSMLLFGASDMDINQKLNLILQKMSELEKKVDKKDAQIEQLKKELNKQKIAIKKQNEETKKEFIVNSCQNIKVKDFNFKYDGVVIPNYKLSYKLVNKYPYTITHLIGRLKILDKDDIVMLTDFIDKRVSIPKNGSITIKKVHTIVSDLERTLKNESPSSIKAVFTPTSVVFANGRVAKCGGFLGVNF